MVKYTVEKNVSVSRARDLKGQQTNVFKPEINIVCFLFINLDNEKNEIMIQNVVFLLR